MVGRLRVSVVDGRGHPVRVPGLARWLARTAPRSVRGEVSIAIVSDARMRALNRAYRKKDHATDVLSFSFGSEVQGVGSTVHVPGSTVGPRPKVHARYAPVSGTVDRSLDSTSRDPGPWAPDPAPRQARGALSASKGGPYLGDIVIARGVAARQAREAGHSLAVELRILALHGLLHLLGYDHECDRGEMRLVERRLRRKAGLRDSLIERASRPHRH